MDSIGATSKGKVRPAKGQSFRTGNDTLKSWVPAKPTLDEVLNSKPEEKITADGIVRSTYPISIPVNYNNSQDQAIPYTFEDALVLANIDLFKAMTDTTGLLKKMTSAVNSTTLDEACEVMFKALDNGKKAEMALDLLFTTEPNILNPPQYIVEGLDWLNTKLIVKNNPDRNLGLIGVVES